MRKFLTFLLALTVAFSTVSAFAFDPGEHNTFAEIGTWDMSQANDTHSVTLSGTETTVTYENGVLVNTIAEGPVLDRITFTEASGTISSGDWAYFELNIDITNISQNDSDQLRWTLRRDGTSVLGNVRISPSVIAVRMRNTSSYTSEKQIISYELSDSERNAPIKIGVLVNKSATTVKLYINGNETGSVDNYTPYYTTINGSSYISVSQANVVGDSYKILGYRVLKKTGTDLPDSGTVPEEPIGGLTFASDSMYLTEKPVATPPLTYEASICLPAGYTARSGIIAGNYYYSGSPCISFEVYNNGVPRIYIVDTNKDTYTYAFNEVNVCTGKYVNLAIAFDTTNTKAYCYVDGTLKQTLNDVNYPKEARINNRFVLGGDMWNEFIKKHENITMVLCGHIPCESIITSQVTGEKGNTITQVLIDPQETDVKEQGTGLVAMLHFSEDGKNVQVRYYSTAKKAYFMTDNQCSFTLNVIDSSNSVPEIKAEGISFNVKLSGPIKGKVVAALYDSNYALIEYKIYDAAVTVPVAFSKSVKNAKIKIMWWDGMNTIVPLAECESIETIVE